ncbi:integrase [Lysobacteraceae bacterium NML91-0213]|nr:integrase [Xanthomonadaceae bacterium NML91-0213]
MLPRYLVQNPSGFYFRIIIPKHLRPLYGRTVIKRTLRTHDARTAQAWALVLADRYAQAFQRASRAMPDKSLEELLRSAEKAFGEGSAREYEITQNRHGTLSVKAEGADDHARAMEALALLQSRQTPSQALPSNADIEAMVPTGLKRITLKKAVEEYKDRIRPNPKDKAKVKTFNGAISTALEDFQEWAGEKTVVFKITRNDLAQFATHMLGTGLAKSTVRNKLSYLTGFFSWAQSAQYFAAGDNPANKHIVVTNRDKRASAKRGWQAFNHEQIKTLFLPDNFKTLKRDATRWIVLLELYTGARPTELAQIDLIDCKEIAGQACIEITSIGDDKREKTEYTERIVPIHPELIKLGFWDKVSAMRMAKETRLFPDLNREALNGPAQVIGKDFTKYLARLSIKPRGDGIMGIRSFRPAVITEMAEASVAQGWRELLVGHEQSEGTQATDHAQRYTQSHLVKVLTEQCLPPLSWAEKGMIDLEKIRGLLK